jgi:beta-aspartyl-dipeptidase (metallo-type)
VVDATGKLVFPGFVDQHVHILGVGAPLGQGKPISFQGVVKSGATSLVGTLGLDTTSRPLPALLLKTKVLRLCGLNALMYTGSLVFPPATLTGSVASDIMLVDEIVGVKVGLGEPSFRRPELGELENLITEVRRAALLSGRQTVAHIHLAASAVEWIENIESILVRRGVPYPQLVLTHVNRSPALLERALRYAKNGGCVDLTTCIRPPERPSSVKPSTGFKDYLRAGGPPELVTFSSDGNSFRVLENGVVDYTRPETILEEFRDCVAKEGIPIPQALAVVTRNPAVRLGMANERGSLREGLWADIVLFSKDLKLTDLMAGGRWLMREGNIARIGPFE